MRLRRVPETNSFGLVLPPSPDEHLEYISLEAPNKRPDTVDRHHLYWPRVLYYSSELARAFREHRFNSVWLLRSDHNQIHNRFDGVPFPPRDVMETYLEEASLLEGLNISIRAIEMIGAAIYEGRVRRLDATRANRNRHLEVVYHAVERAGSLEVIPGAVARLAAERALGLTEELVA